MAEKPKIEVPIFTPVQLQAAIAAGLTLSSPESEAVLPVKLAGGVLILHQLLLALGSGKLGIVPVIPKKDPKAPNPPAKPPGTPNSKKKRKPKKRAVKAAIRAVKK